MRLFAIAVLALVAGCPGPQNAPADVECVRDQDCALLPQATCCGECPPSPPFEVGTREDLDAIFIELETRCAEDLRECVAPACEAPPAGCYAKAACAAGRCVVETEGCGVPTS